MASIREIAEKAKVAPGTVSRALNNKGYISKETRQKIEQALKELEYVPNELARNLYRNRSNMVAMILPDIEHPFFMSIIKHLVKILKKYDYHVVLWTTDYNPKQELAYLEMLKRNVVDGVVIAIPLLENSLYQSVGRPIVMLDKLIDGIPLVSVNHMKAGYIAADKFAENGRKHVIVTSGAIRSDIPSSQREVAFKQRCQELGIRVESFVFNWNRFDPQYADKIAGSIFEQFPETDGILTSDLFATACYKFAKVTGRSIPEEFAIISTDGIYSSDYNVVSFSSVIQPTAEIAKKCAAILKETINGGNVQTSKMIDVYFEQGDTTK